MEKKRTGLTQNGGVMVLRDEPPVIPVTKGQELTVAVDTALNFLRSDHPAAQIHVHKSWLLGNGIMGESVRNANTVDFTVSQVLKLSSQLGENFLLDWKWRGDEYPGRQSESRTNRYKTVEDVLITITRTVKPQWELACFGELQVGEHFRTPSGILAVKTVHLDGNRNANLPRGEASYGLAVKTEANRPGQDPTMSIRHDIVVEKLLN